MSKVSTLISMIKHNPRGIFITFFEYLVKFGLMNSLNDKQFIRLSWFIHFGKLIPLDEPVSFNEKLQWLKLYDRKQRYINLVDKEKVKFIASSIIGEDYIIKTLGVWDSCDDIDLSSLPSSFVLKCTHDSGSVILVKDKRNFNNIEAKNKLQKALSRNLFFWGREWPYKNVKPRIIAEEYLLCDSSNDELIDYKLMCFNGKVKCSFVCTNRFSDEGLKVTFYDRQWNKMPFERHYPSEKNAQEKPQSYNEMVELAEKLSKGIPFVRVDFYEIKGRPYFGEMTFFPGNGMEEFTPKEWDNVLGSWIKLPEKTVE